MNNTLINRALATYNPRYSLITVQGIYTSASQNEPSKSADATHQSSALSALEPHHQKTCSHQITSITPPQARNTIEMTQSEIALLRKLQQRDMEVHTHEQAHISAGGRYIKGGANYSYKMGPDGRLYAVGGEVSIDATPVPNDPKATIEKAETIRRAALAPKDPSFQDLQVAAKASRMEAEAMAELRGLEGKSALSSDTIDSENSLSEHAIHQGKSNISNSFSAHTSSNTRLEFESIRHEMSLNLNSRHVAQHYLSHETIVLQQSPHQVLNVLV
jgi:hypothetical protein